MIKDLNRFLKLVDKLQMASLVPDQEQEKDKVLKTFLEEMLGMLAIGWQIKWILFFEDDFEEWSNDDIDIYEKEFKSFSRGSDAEEDFSSQEKRPLESISLRLKENIVEQQKSLAPSKDDTNQDWEEDSFFQTNKWQRPSQKKDEYHLEQRSDTKRLSLGRNFPRSRRSRL